MGIDYSVLAIPKGPLRVEAKREKRLSDEEAERACREEVWRRYGRKCGIPGCKEWAVHQHHIVYRSKSRRLKYAPENRAPICQTHHDLEHGGKITIHPRTADGELIVTGDRKYLAFKLLLLLSLVSSACVIDERGSRLIAGPSTICPMGYELVQHDRGWLCERIVRKS